MSEIDFLALRDKCGIRAVVFDKDNTLTAPYKNTVHPLAKIGLESALDVFGKDHVAILSNSAGTNDDPDFKDAKEIEEAMSIPVIRHAEKKPGGLKEVLSHFKDIEKPDQIAMVGDRLLTDVVFGNLFGMLTVHTEPLCVGEENKNDNTIASILRTGENKLLYGNWFGGRMLLRNTLPHSAWPGEVNCPLVLSEEKQ